MATKVGLWISRGKTTIVTLSALAPDTQITEIVSEVPTKHRSTGGYSAATGGRGAARHGAGISERRQEQHRRELETKYLKAVAAAVADAGQLVIYATAPIREEFVRILGGNARWRDSARMLLDLAARKESSVERHNDQRLVVAAAPSRKLTNGQKVAETRRRFGVEQERWTPTTAGRSARVRRSVAIAR